MAMKKILVLSLIINNFVHSADSLGKEALSLPMPASYWPGSKITLGEALGRVEINALSSFPVAFEESAVDVPNLLYWGFVDAASLCLNSSEELSKSFIEFVTSCEVAAKNKTGRVGKLLANLRQVLISKGVTQNHFNWIQNNKADSEITAELVRYIHACYEDDSYANNLFLYLDKKVKETPGETLKKWQSPDLKIFFAEKRW